MALYLGSNRTARANIINVIKLPIVDISDSDELTSMLTIENVGNVYRYTGETNSIYTNGDLYEVVSL